MRRRVARASSWPAGWFARDGRPRRTCASARWVRGRRGRPSASSCSWSTRSLSPAFMELSAQRTTPRKGDSLEFHPAAGEAGLHCAHTAAPARPRVATSSPTPSPPTHRRPTPRPTVRPRWDIPRPARAGTAPARERRPTTFPHRADLSRWRLCPWPGGRRPRAAACYDSQPRTQLCFNRLTAARSTSWSFNTSAMFSNNAVSTIRMSVASCRHCSSVSPCSCWLSGRCSNVSGFWPSSIRRLFWPPEFSGLNTCRCNACEYEVTAASSPPKVAST